MWSRELTLAFTLAAGAVFLARTLVVPAPPVDLTTFHAGAAAWLHGDNPYRFEDLVSWSRALGGSGGRRHDPALLMSIYPPSAYLILAPLAAVSGAHIRLAFYLANSLLMVAIFAGSVALMRQVGLRLSISQRLLLAALLLLWGPIHTAIRTGQISVLLIALLLWGVLWQLRRQWFLAGVALGIASALKPHLGLPILLVTAVRRDWRSVICACCVGAGILAAAVLRLQLAGHPWLDDLRRNVAQFTGPGGYGDPGGAERSAHLILSLPTLLQAIYNEPTAASMISWAVSLAVAISVLAVEFRRSQRSYSSDFLVVALIATLTLLPTYHRYYDAVLLIFPLLWVLSRIWAGTAGRAVAVTAACLLVFLLPNTAAVIYEVVESRLPQALVDTAPWLVLVSYHQVWIVLVVVAALAWEQRRAGEREVQWRSAETSNS